MLKLISIAVPAAFLVSGVGGVYIYKDLSAQRTEWARADVYRALEGDVAAQVRVAQCYKLGCGYAARDAVYACAWYKIIADEEHGTTSVNYLPAKRQTCASVDQWDRPYIDVAVKEIRRELKLQQPHQMHLRSVQNTDPSS